MKFGFKNMAQEAVIKIYDDIGSWSDEFSVKDIDEALEQANGKPLAIHINSNGGEVFEGFAIYNAIKNYKGQKTTYVDGLAASIASVIALAGDKVVMNKASMFMVHNAWGGCFGNAEEMRQVADALEQINSVIKSIYLQKTNLDEAKITELMNNETFIKPDDCLAYGFCDEILNDEEEVNQEPAMNKLLADINDRISTLQTLKNIKVENKVEAPKPKSNKTKAFFKTFLTEE